MQGTVDDCLDPDITFRFPRLTEHLIGAVNKFLTDRLAKVIEVLQYHIKIESAFTTTSRKDFRAKLVNLMANKNITDSSFAYSALMYKVSKSTDGHRADAGEESESLQDEPMDSGSEVSFDRTNEYASIAYDSDEKDRLSKGKKPIKKKNNSMDDGQIVRSLVEAYFEIVRQSIRDYVPKLLTHSMIYYACDNLQVYLVCGENLKFLKLKCSQIVAFHCAERAVAFHREN